MHRRALSSLEQRESPCATLHGSAPPSARMSSVEKDSMRLCWSSSFCVHGFLYRSIARCIHKNKKKATAAGGG